MIWMSGHRCNLLERLRAESNSCQSGWSRDPADLASSSQCNVHINLILTTYPSHSESHALYKLLSWFVCGLVMYLVLIVFSKQYLHYCFCPTACNYFGEVYGLADFMNLNQLDWLSIRIWNKLPLLGPIGIAVWDCISDVNVLGFPSFYNSKILFYIEISLWQITTHIWMSRSVFINAFWSILTSNLFFTTILA